MYRFTEEDWAKMQATDPWRQLEAEQGGPDAALAFANDVLENTRCPHCGSDGQRCKIDPEFVTVTGGPNGDTSKMVKVPTIYCPACGPVGVVWPRKRQRSA